MMRAMQKFTDPLKRRIGLMLGRAALALTSDSGKRQYVQFSALKGETRDRVERMQQYGLTSHALPGAQVFFACIGGNRDHPVAINIDDPRFRLSGLQPGEVALYNHEGTKVILKNSGEIHVLAATKVRIETPLLECTGEIKDLCDSGGMTMSDMRNVYNNHTHPENDSIGPTDAPNQSMGS